MRVLVAQLCPTFCDFTDFTTLLEWVAIFFSRGSSKPRDSNQISCIAGGSLPLDPPGKMAWLLSPNHLASWCLYFPINDMEFTFLEGLSWDWWRHFGATRVEKGWSAGSVRHTRPDATRRCWSDDLQARNSKRPPCSEFTRRSNHPQAGLRKEEENKIRQNHKEIQEVTEKKIQPNPPRV